MSSEKAERGRQAAAGGPARAGTTRRTASTARAIGWGFWWRRLLGWLFVDMLFVALLAVVFAWQSARELPAPALDGITTRIFGARVIDAGRWGFAGVGANPMTWEYRIFGADGVTYSFPLAGYVGVVTPFLVALGMCELISLLHVVSDVRRVRRRLQPLNDLAAAAEAVGSAATADPMSHANAKKMATLEAAIERASVDAPQVTTGDADLASIEIALNGLLRQMQEAKLQQMRFVSDASHELRTPIAVIQGYVNLLDRWGTTDKAVLAESIEALKAESEHMQELVEQLLFLARGDSGRNTLQRATINLAAMVREVWEESSMIDADHAYVCTTTEADADDAAYAMAGDLAMLKQSMRIVVGNAAKYSPRGSSIRLCAIADANSVSYQVSDEGIGMSQADLPHIFDRFWRADAGRDSGAEGSGLGLSIARWIVDAHGGTISVLSREGVGTRVTVSLPRGQRMP